MSAKPLHPRRTDDPPQLSETDGYICRSDLLLLGYDQSTLIEADAYLKERKPGVARDDRSYFPEGADFSHSRDPEARKYRICLDEFHDMEDVAVRKQKAATTQSNNPQTAEPSDPQEADAMASMADASAEQPTSLNGPPTRKDKQKANATTTSADASAAQSTASNGSSSRKGKRKAQTVSNEAEENEPAAKKPLRSNKSSRR